MTLPLSTTNDDLHRAAIRATLAQRAGDATDASAIAEATLNLWQQMNARLVPVIGAQGVDAIFSRSLHLTSAAFPWLAITGAHDKDNAALDSFKACLAAREAGVAAEASYVLLVTFTELLATMIGESLTQRLLRPVWASPPPSSAQETPP